MPKITFGLIGIGHFGKHYARLLQETDGAELTMVASKSYDTLNRVSFLLPDHVKKTTNAREIIENKNITCVIIATPAPSHFLLAKDALLCGKHVLVEKPMVTKIEDAYALKKIVEKSGCIFMVGHQYLYNDFIRYLKKDIEQGRNLGNMRYFFAEQMSLGPVRRDIGCVWELATHEIAILDYLCSPGAIKSVQGSSKEITRNEREDFASFKIEFENGLLAAITVSWLSPQKTRKIIFCGDRGIAIFDDIKQKDKLCIYTSPASFQEFSAGTFSNAHDLNLNDVLVPSIKTCEPLKNELNHFIDCVKTQSRPLTDIIHGIKVTEYLDCVSKNIRKI